MKIGHLLILFFLAAVWGAAFLCVRVAAPQFGPLALIELRIGLSTLFLLPMIWNRKSLAVIRRHWLTLLIVGLFNSAVPFLMIAYSMLSMSAGLGAILNSTTSLFGALVASIWLKARLSTLQMAGIVIGLIGVVILVWNQISFQPGGSGLAVLASVGAAALYGFMANYVKKNLSDLPASVIATGTLGESALFFLPPTLWWWPAQSPGLVAWISVVALAAACTSMAYLIYYYLIARIGPTRATTVTFLIPLFGVIWGAWFLDEPVPMNMVGGGIV
ncbi:MAG: DMT family transporter, partial [Deltaproteobacteria bacterium]|nr:DMT family transporter [Deltaproteobacteria bacterium]